MVLIKSNYILIMIDYFLNCRNFLLFKKNYFIPAPIVNEVSHFSWGAFSVDKVVSDVVDVIEVGFNWLGLKFMRELLLFAGLGIRSILVIALKGEEIFF